MAPFKDEHLLIIAPGSHTTLAQVGLPEAFTPPRVRIRSRMFPTETPGKFEPYRIRPKPRHAPKQNGVDDDTTDGVAQADEDEEEGVTLEEDPFSDEGAIWPIQLGRIVDWPAFFALMQHLHTMLGGGFHTPILLIAQPAWTPVEHIRITRFFFEKFKCPAFALMDAAQAMSYAYGVHTACVVDIGKDKADVTAISEFSTHQLGRGVAIPGIGGEDMTQHLLAQLKDEGWDREMCEQLKMSPICEILPAEVPIPGSKEALAQESSNAEAAASGSTAAKDKPTNPASAASTGADGSGANQRHTAGANGEAPRGPGQDESGRPSEIGDEDTEGVIDVASIVAGGKTSEYLARKEREKAEKAAAAAARKKGGDAAAAIPKAVRLRNSEKEFNSFVFEDKAAREQAKDAAAAAGVEQAPLDSDDTAAIDEPPSDATVPAATTTSTADESAAAAAVPPPPLDTTMADAPPADSATADAPASAVPQSAASTTAPDLTSPSATLTKDRIPSNPYTRTLTAGPARFRALPEAFMPTLTAAIHTAIQSVPAPPHTRQLLWDHILLTGQGARVRGLKEALLAALAARYTVFPSSASIFTSEPPSSFGTPAGTGTNTPLPPGQSALPSAPPTLPPPATPGAAVNPLLYAATTAAARPPGQQPQQQQVPAAAFPPGTPIRSGVPGTPAASAYRGGTPVASSTPGGAYTGVTGGRLGHGSGGGGTSQTPTGVKPGRLPEYFGEWKEAGAEYGAVFLGAQVAAKVVFLADVQGGSNKGFMSRSDYNEQGPSAIADYSL